MGENDQQISDPIAAPCAQVQYYFQQPDGGDVLRGFGGSVDFPADSTRKLLIYFENCAQTFGETAGWERLYLGVYLGADTEENPVIVPLDLDA